MSASYLVVITHFNRQDLAANTVERFCQTNITGKSTFGICTSKLDLHIVIIVKKVVKVKKLSGNMFLCITKTVK